MRLAKAHHLLRSQSRVILEVPGYVRLRSHAPSGLASNALKRADNNFLPDALIGTLPVSYSLLGSPHVRFRVRFRCR